MVNKPSPSFNYPIPGQGMTAEVGGRPWQNPPKYATVDEALEHYLPRITSPEMTDELLDIMEMGVPITSLADTMQSGGLMQGLHTVDVGILILPVLMEMLAYIAEDADIEYELGMKERVDEDKIPESKIALSMRKMRKEMPEAMNGKQDNVVVEEPVEEAPEEEEVAPPAGLMSRRM